MSVQATRLRQAREGAGFESAAAAARAKGWTTATYRHHENGTRRFNSDYAQEYGRAFAVSSAWLMGLSVAATKDVEERIRDMLRSFDGYVGELGDLNEKLKEELYQQLVRVIPLEAILRYGDAALFTSEDKHLVFPSKLVHSLALIRPDDIIAVIASGSDMAPTINEGATLLVDAGNREPTEHDQIWVYSFAGMISIRRLRFTAVETAVAIGDAPGIQPFEIDVRDGSFSIHGRVVWIGQPT